MSEPIALSDDERLILSHFVERNREAVIAQLETTENLARVAARLRPDMDFDPNRMAWIRREEG